MFFPTFPLFFLKKASERFKAYTFVDYRLCNIEQGPREQGFEPHSFDLVIAMNMVHATADLGRSLRNVRKFLAPGGMVILLEGTAPERWIDITFGLTDGWWAFTDTRLRATYPLLSRQQWCEVLAESGFEKTTSVPEASSLSQEVIIMAINPEDSAKRTEKNWNTRLIFADKEGIGAALAGDLQADGVTCITVYAGQNYQHPSPFEWVIKSDDPESYRQLFTDLKKNDLHELRGIIHLWSLDARLPSSQVMASLEPTQRIGSGSLLFLLQAMGETLNWANPPGLFVVTKGAQAADNNEIPCFHQSSLWGLAKVVVLEHPELGCRCIDLDPGDSSLTNQSQQLLHEIRANDGETLIAYRDNQRLATRLERIKNIEEALVTRSDVAVQPMRLEKSASGVLEDLQLVPMERRKPEKGEVEIQVRSIGLGFRDVMNALAMRNDSVPLGSECAGRVAEVGEGVEHLKIR